MNAPGSSSWQLLMATRQAGGWVSIRGLLRLTSKKLDGCNVGAAMKNL